MVAVAALLGVLSALPAYEAVPGEVSSWQVGGAFGVLAVGLLSLVRDRPVLSPLGLLQVVAVVGGAGTALYAAAVNPEAFAAIPGWVSALPARLPAPLPLGAALLAGLVALIQAIRLDHPVERGLAWCVPLVALAAAAEPGSLEAHLHLSAAGLLLMLSMVETSYALAYRDELTGLPTRRALVQYFDAIGSSYAVAMVDVDHFKQFNDKHGHDVGDQVLKMVAAQLDKVTGGGKSFRYGGEEFTVVFPGKTRDDAVEHLERLRARIEESSFTVRRFGRPRKKPDPKKKGGRKAPRAGKRLSVTVSIGVAERGEKAKEPEAVIKVADQALYRAKKRGRNRVAR